MTLAPHRCFSRRARYHSFTLVELLTVISILVILAAVSIPALVSISSERDLANSANVIWNMADLAHSEAVARSTIVDLCVVTGTPAIDTPPFREIGLWAHDQTDSSSTNFIQISKWEHLPNSVQIASGLDPWTDYGLTNTAYQGVHITNYTNTVTFNGQALTVNCFQFLPNGGVLPPSGTISTNLYIFVLKSHDVNKAALLKDWRMIQISSLAGQSKVIAP